MQATMQATVQSTCPRCGRRPSDHSVLVYPDGAEELLCAQAAERQHHQHHDGWFSRVAELARRH